MEDKHVVFYDYSKYCLDNTKSSYDALGTKLAAVMEISALLLLGLRITSSFQTLVPLNPAYLYYGYLVIKLSASFCLVIAISFGILGMFPRSGADVAELLVSNSDTDQNLRYAIAQSWQEALIQLRSHKAARTKFFRYALISLGIGVFFAAASTFLAFLFAIIEH